MNSKVLIWILLFLFIFSFNSVYAVEDVNSTAFITDSLSIASDNNDFNQVYTNESFNLDNANGLSSSNNEDEILSAGEGTFTELQELINNAAVGSTVTLDKDYQFKSDSDNNILKTGIKIENNNALTIDGNGHTIDANNSCNIFKITADNIVVKNLNLINGYVYECNNLGVVVSWFGKGGVLDNVTIKNNVFASTRSAGSYNWWNSGIIYWEGENGVVNNANFISNTVASSKGIIVWCGSNGTINNSYFNDFSNTYNSYVGYYEATSFFIYWNADNGKFLNSRVENLKLSTRNVLNPYYVSFVKPGLVENVVFKNCQHSNSGNTVCDLNMPFTPVEDYVNNFTGTFNKQTPTINVSDYVVSPNLLILSLNAYSGSITYNIDNGVSHTLGVDNNGYVRIDLSGLSDGEHLITYSYNGNTFYNDVPSQSASFIYKVYSSDLIFTTVSKSNGQYDYSFILTLKDGNSKYITNEDVTYNIISYDGSTKTIMGVINTTVSWSSTSPLLSLSAVAKGQEIVPTYYPLKALQFIIDVAKSGDTIVLPYNYLWVNGIDTSGITVNKANLVIDGNGYTVDANKSGTLFKVTSDNVILKNMTLSNAYAINVNNIGVDVSWSGSNGVLDNVTIKDNIFHSTRNAGNYNWWNSGMIYWNGQNGIVNNTRFISNTVVSSKGIIIWTGRNGTVNNSYFYDFNNNYNNMVGFSQATSFFIYWNADEGKLLNSRVENLKLGVRDVQNPYLISFAKKGHVDNITFINSTNFNRGQTVYDLNMPFDPVEDYVSNFTGLFNKHTPTISIDTSNNIFTIAVKNVRSGNITYSIDGVESRSVNVDNNGYVILDYNFNPSQNYLIKIIYNGNNFYNSVTEYYDYNLGREDVFGSFTDLNNIISSSNSTINLDKNYIYDPVKDAALSDGIIISKSLTINGNNHYIDADFYSVRIFTTISSDVVLNDIIFKNSYLNSSGNAVLAKSPIIINNCTFDNNWAYAQYGGAVNLEGDNSIIQYSTFTNNKALTGAAVTVNSNNNYILHSYFKGNAKDYGGSIDYGSDIFLSNDKTVYVNYNVFLDPRPLKHIPAQYSRDNWYGINSAPEIEDVSNYLKASLNYTVKDNVLNVGISFTESDTGDIVQVKWANQVIYTINSNILFSDTLNTVNYSGVGSNVLINAIVDNQKLTNQNSQSWYVKTTGNDYNSGTESSPFKTLNKALQMSSNGDVIYIAPGIYTGTSNVKLSISKSLTIDRWGSTGDVIFDGQNKYGIFTLNSNVVLSSLTFKNGKGGNGGALVIKSDSILIDCTFIDNVATSYGGAIDMDYGGATIINSCFINNSASSGGGSINTADVNLNIINSIFTNNFGARGGAINSGNTAARLFISDSTFINNSATSYGGALVFDGEGNISNSLFINNSAGLGGGAVYMWDYNHTITNSEFINNSAVDGGAIIALSANLIMSNNHFNNNIALGFGGAVYGEIGDFLIFKNDFSNNMAYYDGGALYVYKGSGSIYESSFKRNIAGYGGGAVHLLASDMLCIRLKMLNNISECLNGFINTEYLNSFIDFGNYTLVVADTSNYDGNLPSYFSLVDNGWDTSVKNQGSLGICWDYAVIATVETAIKKATGIEVDLSENNVKNLISMYSIYGNGRNPNAGGVVWDALSYLSNSLGPVYESTDVTSAMGFSPLLSNVFHVSNIAFATRSRDNPLNNDEVKEAIIKYGAVRVSINMDDNYKRYNYYHPSNTGTNHAIAIVGWDDNYSASNFPNNCPGDGAWIVKNSWGPNTGNKGYIYVSYYDQTFAWDGLSYIIFNDTIRYSRVYQYDYSNYGMKSVGNSFSWYKNTYTSVKNEVLSAFSTYFNTKTDWEVSVYVGDELKLTQNGNSISSGYFTFNFDEVIPVAKGDKFTIALKVNNNHVPFVSKTLNALPCGEGVSFYSKDGVTWTDFNKDNSVACLKVFTQNIPGSLISINPINNVTYSSDVTVRFAVENRTSVNYFVTNKNGKIVVNVTNCTNNQITLTDLDAGEYTITIINEETSQYIGDVKSANFIINKANSTISINSIDSIIYGSIVNVKFNCINATTLSYIVMNKSNVIVVNKTAISDLNNFNIKVLDAGNYTVVISNDETTNYLSSNASAQFTINKSHPIITLNVSDIVYSDNVGVGVESDVDGSFVVSVGGISKIVDLTANKYASVDFGVLAADTYDVVVDYAETANYNAASKEDNLVVSKANSSVIIYDIESVDYGDKVTVAFSIINSTVVSYIVKSSSGAIVVSNITLTSLNSLVLPVLGAGDYVIVIANAGNQNYSGSNYSARFVVNKATPVIILNVSDVAYSDKVVESDVGDKFVVNATLIPADAGKLDFISSNVSVVTVNDIGKVTTVREGNATITVIFAGNDNYTALNTTISVVVSKIDTLIDVKDNVEMKVGESCDLNATLIPADAGALTYSSSNSSVVKVEGGKLVAVGEGSVNITVSFAGNDKYNAAENNIITVTVSLNDASIAADDIVLDVGANATIAVITNPKGLDVTYIPDNSGVVKVENGVVTGLKGGIAYITLKVGDGKVYTINSTTITVTVNKIDTSIEVDEKSLALHVGDDYSIVANLTPVDAGNVVFTSSNPSVVTVDKNGDVKAIGNGSAMITVSYAGSDKYNAAKDVSVAVTVGLNNVCIVAEDIILDVGANATIEVTTNPEGLEVTYTPDNSGVVTVENGVVTALKEGSAKITLTVGGDGIYAVNSTAITVTVNKIDTSIEVDKKSLVLHVGDDSSVVAKLTPSEAGNLTFTSSDENVVQVNDGKIIAVGKGTATITVSFAGDEKYAAENKIITVTVNINDASITAKDITLNVGENAIIDATTTLGGLAIDYVVDDSGVVTVEDGLVTALKAGTATITLNIGDGEVYAKNSTTITVTVNKIDTSISVVNKSLELYVDEEGYIVATLNSDGGYVNFTSSDDSIVTVDNFGYFKAVTEGTATITVSFAGDDKYNAAEDVNVTVNVSKIDTSIEFNYDPIKLTVHNETIVTATLKPAEAGNVTYTSSNPSIVTVDSKGNVKAVSAGNATITASFAGNNKYNEAENVTVPVTVSKIDTKITVNTDSLDLKVDDETSVKCTLNPVEAGIVSYMSNDTSVVTVDKNGDVKAIGNGSAMITASYMGSDKYNAAKDVSVAVTVSLNNAEVNAKDIILDVGANATIDVTTDPEGLDVTYIPDNSGVVTVENGVVTAVKEGTADVTITIVGNGKYYENSTTITVTVNKIDTSISVVNKSLELYVDEEGHIVATLNPDGGDFNFTSSDDSIVTVDNFGDFKAVGEGTATIIVSFAGDDKYNVAEDVNVTVKVSKIDTSIEFNYDPIKLTVHNETIVTATLKPAEAGNVTYTSSNPSVVTVDSKGNVKAVGAGNATITASFAGNNKYNEAENVTVPVTVSKIDTKITVDTESLDLKVGNETAVKGTLIPVEVGNVSYMSNNTSVVIVDEITGKVTAIGEGTATITVFYGGDDEYNVADDVTIPVTVSKIDTSIAVNGKVDIRVGGSVDVGATLTPADAGDLIYKSDDDSVVKVEDGMLVAVGEGTATIIVSFAGDDRYNAAENVTVFVKVSRIDTYIEFNVDSIDLKVNDKSIVIADLKPAGAGDVVYTSSNSSVVIVDAEGNVKAVGAGEAIITASFAGNNKYNEAKNVSIPVTVSKIDTFIDVKGNVGMKVGESCDLNATLTPADAGALIYSSNNTSVVKVENGKLVAVGEGTATVTISFTGNNNYAAENKTIVVTVSINDARIFAKDIILDVGANASVDVITDPESLTVEYIVDNSDVIKVENGVVTGLKGGIAYITLKVGDGKVYAVNSTTITVTVNKVDTSIYVENKSFELKVDDENHIVSILTPDVGDVKFTSSDDSVVKVEDGMLVAVGEGTAAITVSFAGDDRYNAAENVTVFVKVSRIDTYIEFNVDSIDLKVNDKSIVIADLKPAGAGDVVYTSSNSSVVIVDAEGNVEAVGAGEAIISASFAGNNKYNEAKNVSIPVTVSKIDTKITVDTNSLDLKVDDETVINANVNPIGVGNVRYFSTNTFVVTVDSEGNVKAVGEGNATIIVSFAGDGNYNAAEDKVVSVTVSKISVEITVDNINVTMNALDSVEVNATLNPKDVGNLTFTSSDYDVVDVIGRKIIANGEGTATITVSFAGNDKYAAAENRTIAVTVNINDASVVAEDITLDVGDNTTIKATTTPEGLPITYKVDNSAIISVDEKGTVVALKEGETIITLEVGDNRTHAINSTTITVTVNKINTSIEVKNKSLKLKVDDETVIKATLIPAEAGYVKFTSSNASVVTVSSEGNVKAIGEGNAIITLSYAGSDRYNAAENVSVVVIVSKIDTNIAVDIESLDLKVDDETVIKATLIPAEAGYVKFISSNASVVTVDSEGNVKAVGGGTAIVIVSFDGDNKYAAAKSKIITVTVGLIDAFVVADDIVLDVGVNATIDVITAPEGLNVIYTCDNSGVVTVEDGVVTAVKAGIAKVILTVGGDGKYAENSTSITVTVNKMDTSISIDAESLDLDVGDDSSVIAKLTPVGAGNIVFTSSNDSVVTVDMNGNVKAVGEGNAIITLSYAGSDRYNAAEDVSVSVTVKEVKQNASMVVDVGKAVEDENFTMAINLPKDATGIVAVIVDGKDYSAPVVNGIATIAIPGLKHGKYTVPVSYSGDDKYKPVSKEIDYAVEEIDKSDIISAPNVTKYYKGSERFVVNVTDYQGNPLANRSVSIVINGLKYDRITKDNGTASIALRLNSGVYDVTVTVGNEIVNSVVTILSTVNGTNVVKVYKNATQYYATFRDSQGNYLNDGTVVKFNIHGVFYERKIFGDKGLAKLNLNLEQGEYILTAMNPETGENTVNNIKIISRIIENYDVTKYFRNGTQYTVKLLGDDGKAVGAGENVTFNINGVMYTRQTNESGITKLNINLQPGDYIITAEYKECKVSNNIKVLPVLSASDISMKYRDGTQFVATLVDGQGSPYGGQMIDFNINGMLYQRKTNDNGQARININLMAGQYIITSSYDSTSIANTITISS